MSVNREAVIEAKKKIVDQLTERIRAAEKEIARLEKADIAFSNLRLVIFMVVLFSIWLFVYHDRTAGAVAGVNSLIVFAGLVYYHNATLVALGKKRAEKELAVERRGRSLENIEGHRDAEKFFVKETVEHPLFDSPPSDARAGESYTVSPEILNDLDFYTGDANLFSLYNTAQTSVGVRKFYNYLKTPLLSPAAIRERSAAVAELAENRAFIDAVMLELHALRGRRFSEFISAVNAPRVLPASPLFRCLLMALSASAVLTLAFGLYEAFAVIYCVNFAVIAAFFEKCSGIKKNYTAMAFFAGPFSNLSAAFESVKFSAAPLERLSASFRGRPAGASGAASPPGRPFYKKLGVLARIAELMLVPVPVILDAVVLSELMLCERIERHTKRVAPELLEFIGALGEFEALASFANIKIDLPEYGFAAVADPAPRFLRAEGLIHPLLAYEKAVANSISFDEGLDIAIITGSNMSGKSTFLKSLAIAVVMAQIGAPVRAAAMSLTPFIILTDIRITDSIKAGVSHFYSELLRVKAVTDRLAGADTVFAIFDELFHGTNSRERLALCTATLEYFQRSGGKFVMATHDRELTALGGRPEAPAVRNFHFEEISDGERSEFTYRLVEGPATAANAVKLARRCGLPEAICAKAEELAEREK